MQIKKIDSLSYVVAHPEIFISPGAQLLHELTSKVAADLVVLESTPFTVSIHSGWRVVASKNNWLLKNNLLPLKDLFSTLVPFPEAGQNSNRSEILLNAYCQDVLVYNDGEFTEIKGKMDSDIRDHVISNYQDQTFLAFR